MPDEPIAHPAARTSHRPLGQRNLRDLIDNFLPHIYPTTAVLKSGQHPNTVNVFGIVKQSEPNDPGLQSPLNDLPFSKLLDLVSGYTFKVTRYESGNPQPSTVYSVKCSHPNPGTSLSDGRSLASTFHDLSMNDIVGLLPQVEFTVAPEPSGQPASPHTISGIVEHEVENNPDLSKPVGDLSAKYVFLLKKLFRFTVTNKSRGSGFAVAMDGNKTYNE